MKTAIVGQMPISNQNTFMSFGRTKNFNLDDYVNVWSESYNSIFDDDYICEKMYTTLNTTRPEHFTGRSLSVSDVVLITDSETHKYSVYYCDSIGWKKIKNS